MDDRKDENENENMDSSWSLSQSSDAQETAGLMAEHIRMRADLDRMATENEELRRSHDALYRLLSEKTAPKQPEQDLKTAVRAVLSEWKDEQGETGATVIGPIPSLDEMRQMEKIFAESADGAKSLQAAISEITLQTRGLGKQVEEMSGKQKELIDLKGKMDQINAQRAWIDSKLQSLGKQKMVVERANVEAGRLNALFWEMEEKMREMAQQNKVISKTQVNIDALESRLRDSHTALQQVERFENSLKVSRKSVEEMAILGEEFGLKLAEFQRSQKNIDEASNRAKEAANIVRSMDATMNTILKNNGQLENTKKLIDGFQETLNGVDKKVEKVHKQWNAAEKLEGKIVKLEEWVKGFQQDLAVASHLGDELKKIERKVGEVKQGENELLRAMEVLETKRAEMISISALAEDARRQSETVINNLEFLKHRQDEIGQVGERVDSLNRFLGQTNTRIRDVEGKLEGFVELEGKMGKLESLVQGTDMKIQEQISRQPAIAALSARIDETEDLALALENKTKELYQHGDRLRSLESRLGELGRMSQEVKDTFGRIGESKESADKQELRFKETLESQRQFAGEFEEHLEKIGIENQEMLAQFASNKERLRSLQEEISAGLGTISGHNQSIKVSEERLKKVDGFLITMEQNMSALEKRQNAMSAFDGKIQEVIKAVEDVESRMAVLRNEKSVIHDARKSVETLHVLMKSVQDRIDTLQAEEKLVLATQESVKGIVSVMGDVEEKFKVLAKERNMIVDAQGQIQNLRLMVDDLKTEIRNVSEEEHKITDAMTKASELEFLIGEADSAIANLKRLKGKA